MRNLLILLARYGGFFIFLALEGICFFLIVQFNKKQELIFISSANRISGNIQEQFDNTVRYIHLNEISDSLAQHNAELLEKIHNQEQQLPAAPFDTLYQVDKVDLTKRQYVFIPARVINNSINKKNNSLTINRGFKQGVKQHMGVISDQGIIGVVLNVNDNYARVMSILHQQAHINSRIRKSNFFGPLTWNGHDPRVMQLQDIPKHASLLKGDTIETSGYSTIFPESIMIGTIDTFWIPSGSNFYSIEVHLQNDLSNTQYVYVVDNQERKDRIDVELTQTNE